MNVFLSFSKILAEGALSINQHCQITEQHSQQKYATDHTMRAGHSGKKRGRPCLNNKIDSLQDIQSNPQSDLGIQSIGSCTENHSPRKAGRPLKKISRIDVTKCVKNPLGRKLYCHNPAPLYTISPSRVIHIPELPAATMAKYSSAVRAALTTDSIAIQTTATIPLFPRYFAHLYNNNELHDDLVLSYLKLLESTRSDVVKVHTFVSIVKLRQGIYDSIDRYYSGGSLFDYKWHIFPILRDHHYTIIVLHIKTQGNDITSFFLIHFMISVWKICWQYKITAYTQKVSYNRYKLNVGTYWPLPVTVLSVNLIVSAAGYIA